MLFQFHLNIISKPCCTMLKLSIICSNVCLSSQESSVVQHESEILTGSANWSCHVNVAFSAAKNPANQFLSRLVAPRHLPRCWEPKLEVPPASQADDSRDSLVSDHSDYSFFLPETMQKGEGKGPSKFETKWAFNTNAHVSHDQMQQNKLGLARHRFCFSEYPKPNSRSTP